jgi:biotin operon repressor
MLNSLTSDARRVYACLELATMGFQQELAVTMSNGKQRPLSPADITHQTGLSRQHVRSGLAELERAGLAKRVADDGKDLRHGHVLIYSFAYPQSTAGEKPDVAARGYIPTWFPESWEAFRPLINRFKLRLIPDDVAARAYFAEGEQIARSYLEAEEVAARFLERVCAQPRINKVERNERDSSNTVGRSVADDRPTDKVQDATPPKLSHRLQAIQDAIPPDLCQKLQDTPTPQLLQKIADALKDAPPENLTARIRARWENITSLGMLVNLAADVYKAFHAKPPAQPPPRPRQAPVQETREEKLSSLRSAIETCQGIAEDRMKPPAERDYQRQRIREFTEQIAALNGNAEAVGGVP